MKKILGKYYDAFLITLTAINLFIFIRSMMMR